MEIKNGLEIVAYQYDDKNIFYAVKDTPTGRYIFDGCESIKEAENERDCYLLSLHRSNAGPFAS